MLHEISLLNTALGEQTNAHGFIAHKDKPFKCLSYRAPNTSFQTNKRQKKHLESEVQKVNRLYYIVWITSLTNQSIEVVVNMHATKELSYTILQHVE